MSKKVSLRLVLCVSVVALLGACSKATTSEPAEGTSPAAGGATVDVALADDSVTLSSSEVATGEITFAATNEGTLTHEIEVFEGDAAPSTLPIESNVANTEGWTLVNEIEDITPGATADLTIDLAAGTYQIVCNLPAHFEKGMYSTLTVT